MTCPGTKSKSKSKSKSRKPAWAKLPQKRKFGGKVYEITGTGSSRVSKTKSKRLLDWAEWQRTVNKNSVRIIKVPGGYAAYMRQNR